MKPTWCTWWWGARAIGVATCKHWDPTSSFHQEVAQVHLLLCDTKRTWWTPALPNWIWVCPCWELVCTFLFSTKPPSSATTRGASRQKIWSNHRSGKVWNWNFDHLQPPHGKNPDWDWTVKRKTLYVHPFLHCMVCVSSLPPPRTAPTPPGCKRHCNAITTDGFWLWLYGFSLINI